MYLERNIKNGLKLNSYLLPLIKRTFKNTYKVLYKPKANFINIFI